MSIYFASGESFDYDLFGTYVSAEIATGANFRSVARCAITAALNSGIINTSWLRANLNASITSCWITFRANFTSATSEAAYPLICLGKSGTRRLGVFGSGTNNKINISKINAANTVTGLATETGTYAINTLYKFDLQIISYGATGTVNLYRAAADGTGSALIATYSGDLTTDSETNLNQIFIGGLANFTSTYLSEIIVSLNDTRGMGLVTCEPAANGNAFNFTGSFADIDDTSGAFATIDGDLVTSNANNDLAQVTLITSRIGTPSAIAAVVISHRSRAGASLPNVTPSLRIAATNYFGTPVAPPVVAPSLTPDGL